MPALSITTTKQRQHAPSGKQQAIPLPWTNPAACKSFPAMQRDVLQWCMAHFRCGLRTHIPVRLPRSWIARAQLRSILHRHARIGIAYRRRYSDSSMSAYARGRLLRGTYTFPFQTMHPYFTAARFVLSRLCVAHVLLLLSSTCVPDFARHVCSCLRAEHALLLPRGTYTFHFQTMHPYFTAARHMHSRLLAKRVLPRGTCVPDFARYVRSCF